MLRILDDALFICLCWAVYRFIHRDDKAELEQRMADLEDEI
jgi:uncharacterized membrane protein YhdT